MSRRTRILVLLLCLGAVLGAAGAAWAYLTAGTAAGSNGQAKATSVLQGSTPTAVSNGGRSVTVSWSATLLANGVAVDGYLVTRYDANTGVAQTIGASCSGTITATSCTETLVPSGAWDYKVTPLKGAHWQGAASAASGTVTVAAAALSLTKTTLGLSDFGGGSATLSGTASGFAASETIAIRLDSATGTLLGTTTANASGSAAVSVSLPRPSDGSHTIYAIGQSSSAQATAGIVVDTAPPSTTDNSASIGSGWFNVTKTVTLTPTDATSGVAATYYTSNGSTPTTSSASGTSVALASDGVYTVKYFSVDNAGNAESVKTASTAIHVDKTAPTASAIGTSGNVYTGGGTTYVKSGVTLTDTATDATVNGASSGVASVAYYYCSGACTPSPGSPGTTLIGTATIAPSYSVTWSSQPADGAYTVLARVTDNAGNTTDKTAAFTVDNTAPTISTALADANARQVGFIHANGTFYAYANVSDTGSGVKTSTIAANLAGQCSSCTSVTLSATGGPFTVYTSSGSVTYTYRSALETAVASPTTSFSVAAQDNLANSTTQAGSVAIDAASTPSTPTAMSLTTGYVATDYGACTLTANAYIVAAQQTNETVTVTTASTALANQVLKLTIGSLSFYKALATAGTQTVTFSSLDLSSIADTASAITMSAVAYSPGGNSASTALTQAISGKLTGQTAATVTTSAFTYTDKNNSSADQVTGGTNAGPAFGFLRFTETAGPHVNSTYNSGQLTSTGTFAAFNLDAATATPTYSVSPYDAGCNVGTAVNWSPTDTK